MITSGVEKTAHNLYEWRQRLAKWQELKELGRPRFEESIALAKRCIPRHERILIREIRKAAKEAGK